jgi:hypothetical protein
MVRCDGIVVFNNAVKERPAHPAIYAIETRRLRGKHTLEICINHSATKTCTVDGEEVRCVGISPESGGGDETPVILPQSEVPVIM